jgi:hypothetical protein
MPSDGQDSSSDTGSNTASEHNDNLGYNTNLSTAKAEYLK